MTQEDKDLLLKDLCARLPYGVKVEYNECTCEVLSIDRLHEELTIWKCHGSFHNVKLEDCKPYLFPFSSMTDEQREELKQEYCNIACDNIKKMFANPDESHLYSSKSSSFEIDWFNKHHVDYRGLIPMCLANDATVKNIY